MRPRVLFVSGREAEYMRNRVLLAALRSQFSVMVLNARVPTTAGRTAANLAHFCAARPSYDVCFAGFYGQPLAIALSKLQQKPLVLDAYVSTFDTLCQDRRWFRPESLPGRLARWLDRRGCEVATRVVTDTQAHADYFAGEFGVPRAKLAPIYVGCDEALFYPRDEAGPARAGIEVFYYGAFLPLHGTEIVVEAAHRLRHRHEIRFTIGGDGPRRAAVERMIAERGLSNVDMVGWIPLERLPDAIARATICLGGHFSTVPKAARVISTKTFQFLAMARPTITGDNPAVREILAHGEQVWAVPMGDARALAEAIETLAGDAGTRAQIAGGGRQRFEERLSTAYLARQLAKVLEEAACAFAS